MIPKLKKTSLGLSRLKHRFRLKLLKLAILLENKIIIYAELLCRLPVMLQLESFERGRPRGSGQVP